MSITTKRAAPKHHPDSGSAAARRLSPRVEPPPLPSRSPVRQRGNVLFEVPFASVMSDRDLARLALMLGLSTRIEPTIRPRHDTAPRHHTPGFARLDHHSGLFLKRGVVDGEWQLEARTWGRPAAQSVHEWHVLAAGAARKLDPTVALPERLDAGAPEISDRPVGRAANKRLARIRRRLVGLP
jgi:hypothetical protein